MQHILRVGLRTPLYDLVVMSHPSREGYRRVHLTSMAIYALCHAACNNYFHPHRTGNRVALSGTAAMSRSSLRLWQRLSTQMVAAFVLVTVFAIGLAALVLLRGLADVPLPGRLGAIRDVQGLHQVLEEVVSA